nr:hypothetical protein [Micromonospora sp. DSM 115978]
MLVLRPFAAALVVTSLLLTAGCRDGADVAPSPPEPLRPAWQRLTLPAPAGESGRLMPRDIAACAGRWYLVGGVEDQAGQTRPAAWTSTDGQDWSALPFVADSYYGRQNVLYSAGCRNGRLAALGAKTGGAHAYPRTSSWWQRGDGALVEVAARFELYGGPTAVNVGRLVGGPAGWLIAGNRSSGAAAWVSPDAAEFELLEGVPELASDDRGVTWAFDAVGGWDSGSVGSGSVDSRLVGGGWLMVGGLLPPGRIDRDPLAWTSPDGRTWRRVPIPATAEYEELQRVALVGATPVAVGLRGRALGAWRGGKAGWTAGGEFGVVGGTGVVPGVSGLAVAGGRLLATVSDGTVFGIWSSTDLGGTWRPVTAPVPMPAGADRDAGLLVAADRAVLFVDPGAEAADSGGLWLTQLGR